MSYQNICIFLLIITLSGCHQKETNTMIGMPNPASVYCVQLHGKLTLVSTPQGQYANCTLPSGTEIEEWTLFRRDHSSSNK